MPRSIGVRTRLRRRPRPRATRCPTRSMRRSLPSTRDALPMSPTTPSGSAFAGGRRGLRACSPRLHRKLGSVPCQAGAKASITPDPASRRVLVRKLGADSWQAGVVASFTGTDLGYRAAAGLSERGYRTGEHRTEIVSLHPFAAWHVPSGGHLWASFGAGTGELRHRDDLGFPSWSRSDVRLRVYGAGASLPLADLLSGALQAEAGIESFAFEVEGGGTDLLVVAHVARTRLARRLGVERAHSRRTFPFHGLPASDGGWTRGWSVGDEGLHIRRGRFRSPPFLDRERGGLVRPRRLRARLLGPRRRGPLRSR